MNELPNIPAMTLYTNSLRPIPGVGNPTQIEYRRAFNRFVLISSNSKVAEIRTVVTEELRSKAIAVAALAVDIDNIAKMVRDEKVLRALDIEGNNLNWCCQFGGCSVDLGTFFSGRRFWFNTTRLANVILGISLLIAAVVILFHNNADASTTLLVVFTIILFIAAFL